MEIFFFWLIFSIVVAVAANSRGRSGLGWFVLSALFSPLLMLILLLILPNRKAAEVSSSAAILANTDNRIRMSNLQNAFYAEINADQWATMPVGERIKYLRELGHHDPALVASRNYEVVFA